MHNNACCDSSTNLARPFIRTLLVCANSIVMRFQSSCKHETRLKVAVYCRQKVLKPPGAKKPPAVKIQNRQGSKKGSKVTPPKSPVSPNTRAAIKAAQQAEETKPRSFRKSTKLKVEEAEKLREWAELEVGSFQSSLFPRVKHRPQPHQSTVSFTVSVCLLFAALQSLSQVSSSTEE